MGKFAIRVLTLAIGAAAVAAIPAITPAAAKASRHVHHMHMKKHGWYGTYPYRGAWVGPPAQPMARSSSDWVCPGISRSFDCKVWPPPFEDDPDRKVSKF
ncbi:hypothetical protein [Bradyrhizobium sp.]|uniref:hypothetical protein n=1 Tax=Bradyrhizobium sp. TaxID=376 RepID=UPI0026104DFF|nr:hypothetical protein [Bradyrhizobium sp.]